jgi:hypothetical protein
MFWAVPNEEIKKTNHAKWLIPLGVFIAIAGIVVTIILLGANSSAHKAQADTPAVPAVKVSAGVVNLNGKWAADMNSSTMLATVTDDGIEIQWANGDDSALYWKGTFSVPKDAGSKFQVISQADRPTMSGSMLASQDETKTFVYENNTINFSVTVIGVTTKVHLHR